MKKNFELLASYNQWMNVNLYRASSQLSEEALTENKGAFFGSILGTLNHILMGDTIWLKRFSNHPALFTSLEPVRKLQEPSSLSEVIHTDFQVLKQAREKMDAVIVNFSIEATNEDYCHELEYKNTKDHEFKDSFSYLVQHFYNHQTHHRGQVTTLLNQMGVDFGVTDMLVKIREL